MFSGALEDVTRAEAKRRVERLGGRAASSIGGNTDCLVVGDEPGSKLDDAREHKVRIIDEKAFRRMVSG